MFPHQATAEKLVWHLVEDHSIIDPTYVEDFLLTYKTFLDRPSEICGRLLSWFLERPFRDKVSERGFMVCGVCVCVCVCVCLPNIPYELWCINPVFCLSADLLYVGSYRNLSIILQCFFVTSFSTDIRQHAVLCPSLELFNTIWKTANVISPADSGMKLTSVE